MKRELARAGVAFERIAAIDGRAIDAAVVEDFRRRRAAKPHAWLPGEVGCFLSHFEAWRRIADGTDSWGVVFEDDIHTSPQLGRCFAQAIGYRATRTLCGSKRTALCASPMVEQSRWRPVERFTGRSPVRPALPLYLLAQAAAVKLIAAPPDEHASVDTFLFRPKASAVARSLRRYQVVPALCIQDEMLGLADAQLKSQIKARVSRGRAYRERSHPLLKLWPFLRDAVPFRP
jgi:glycosyl transferase family 25